MDYLHELAGLMAVFAVMIVAPGADTAVVMRQSLAHGRAAGVWTSAGVAAALLTHVAYTALGLGLVVAKSLLLFSVLKYLGAAFLIFLGLRAIFAPAGGAEGLPAPAGGARPLRAFWLGYATNALNPKALLFFLSMFAALVSPRTPFAVVMAYGLVMSACLFAWFSLLANFLTLRKVREGLRGAGRWIGRAAGVVFVGLGIKLALASPK